MNAKDWLEGRTTQELVSHMELIGIGIELADGRDEGLKARLEHRAKEAANVLKGRVNVRLDFLDRLDGLS